jgi:protein-S-isoprenylcysteine O-methyltransferase Ste14
MGFMLYCATLVWIVWWGFWLLVGRNLKKDIYREPFLNRLKYRIPMWIGIIFIFGPIAVEPIWQLDCQWLRILGLILTISGLLFSCWARLHLGKNWSALVVFKDGHELVSTGPYLYVRHPIYTGIISAMIGTAMIAGSPLAAIGIPIVVISFAIKLLQEEVLLRAMLGWKYDTFCYLVPWRLYPGI